MEIRIYGAGCAKCRASYDLISRVAAETGADVTVTKVEDMAEIAGKGILFTLGIEVDGDMKLIGKMPEVQGLTKHLAGVHALPERQRRAGAILHLVRADPDSMTTDAARPSAFTQAISATSSARCSTHRSVDRPTCSSRPEPERKER